jgi:hypothetical protein
MVGVFFIPKTKKRGKKMAYLRVNGVDLSPYVNKMETSHEPVWNSKAGRAIDANATFAGRIITRKWKLNIGIRVLSQSESAIIHKALKSADFLSVEFIPTDGEDDTLKTITCYSSAQKNTVYSYVDNVPRYSGMSFSLVEQ